jgi:hypothetical protein
MKTRSRRKLWEKRREKHANKINEWSKKKKKIDAKTWKQKNMDENIKKTEPSETESERKKQKNHCKGLKVLEGK